MRDQPTPDSDHKPSLIVALGASAGGVAALREIFRALPPELDAAFIVIQHLEPGADEVAREVIEAAAKRPVCLVDQTREVCRNHVYVVPPRSVLTVAGRCIATRPVRDQNERSTEIDLAFTALATWARARLIAIALSGEGRDGTRGLGAVHEHDGLVIAQRPETAGHPAMVEAAIESGVVDRVLSPAEIAAVITDQAAYATRVRGSGPDGNVGEQVHAALGAICDILQRHTTHDFKYYKTSTLVRRVRRRMQILHLESVDAYIDRLETNATEPEALFRELLISVTSFFRDPEAFAFLDEHVLGPTLARLGPDAKFRAWVPGCSTGEEVYSLAMLLCERLDHRTDGPRVQIIATDIDERALNIARKGIYPASIEGAVGVGRLRRFFTRVDGAYHVNKELREMCLFSSHNLINDPPFSRVDLISCRNVLIYIGAALQKKLIPVFHYALKAGGHLFLGSSESLTAHEDLFRVLSDQCRVARRRAVAVRAPTFATRGTPTAHPSDAPRVSESDLHLIAQRMVLDEFAPRYAVVNEEGHIVSVSAHIAEFLEPSEGAFSNSIFRLAPAEIRAPLRAGFKTVSERCTRVTLNVRRRAGRNARGLNVVIDPLPKLGDDRNLFLIVFREVDVATVAASEVRPGGSTDEAYIEKLEFELTHAREDLDRTIQDLEASNEELKSSNEELLSMNEELQSANEELEASKEEIQKSNLALQRGNEELGNLFASTRIATLFLDRDLRIRGFTPAVAEIFSIQETDVGRPIADLTTRALDPPEIVPGAGEVEIRMPDDRVFLRRTLPYVTQDDRQDGIVLTFIDVTDLRRSERRFRALIQASGQMVWVTDAAGNLVEDSPSWRDYTGQADEEWHGLGWLNVVHPDDRERSLLVWKEAVRSSTPYDVEYRVRHVSGVYRWTRARGIAVLNADGTPGGWIGINQDVHERKTAQIEYERSVDASPAILWTTAQDGTCTYLSRQWLEFTGQTASEGLGFGWADAVHPDDRDDAASAFMAATRARATYYREFRLRTRAGEYRWVIDAGNPRYDHDGAFLGMAGTVLDIHERRLAEEARAESETLLRVSEAKFRTITDAMPQMVWSTEPDGTPDYFNRRWYEFTGLEPGQMLAHEWAELVHADDRAAALAAWARSLATGDPFQAEMRLRHVSGTFRWVLARALPVRDAARVITRWMGTSTDIHDRRVVAEALSLSEERYRVLTEVSPQMMWTADRTGAVTYVNQSWVDFSGRSVAEIAGAGWLDVVQADHRARVAEIFETAMRTLTPFESEIPFRRHDGVYRWFFAKGLPVRDQRGVVDRWVGVAVDVHEIKTARDRIEANEALLKTITDNTTSSLFMMDERGFPTFMNPAAERLTGFKLQEIAAAPLHNAIHSRRPDGSPYPIEECPIDNAYVELKPVQDGRETFTDKSGRIFPVTFSVAPLERDGRVRGSVLEFRDVSAQREFEDQIRAAKDAAEDANEAKSTFLANMSHEIRTPLGAICGFSELLDGLVDKDSDVGIYVSRISRNSAQLSQLIDELLDLSKIEAKRLVVETANVDLAAAIEDVFAAVSLQAKGRNLDLVVHRESDVPAVLSTDPTRFRQILINLIGNAVKFSEDGRVSVDVRRGPHQKIEIRIVDGGIGLTEEQKQRLFRPFSQADSSITRKYGGTGLGLALSRDLARLLGGEIVLERTAPGQGSTFLLTLPISTALVTSAVGREDQPLSESPPLAGRQILVVDDSPDNQLLVSHFLERSGAKLDQASDGLEALEKANHDVYDVILMDLQMPRMDGYSALKALRGANYARPIVALTAHALKSERDRCFDSGFDGYVTKPIDRRALLRTIKDLLV